MSLPSFHCRPPNSPFMMADNLIIILPFLFSLLGTLSPQPATCQILPSYSGRQGRWQLLHASVGVSGMHMQLLHNNKVVIFDRTDFGPSNISLPRGRCRSYRSATGTLKSDCTAHSIIYHTGTNSYRPLMIQTDTWCSSGAVLPNGTLVQTGGYHAGDHVVRMLDPCDNCDWVEFPGYLSERRWYATAQVLPDGRIIIVGGRRQFNYEFYPRNNGHSYTLSFLRETRDEHENNLYPFLHLLPDGNLFIFANTRSISLDYDRNRVVKEFPSIPDGNPRNYPSSGSSVLLPLDENNDVIEAEIMICGGAPLNAYPQVTRGTFVRAISTCGRLRVTDENPNWVMEEMPTPRVMGDMVLLPTGDIIIVNGAESGTAGWENGRVPVTRPVIYTPNYAHGRRFSVMNPANRPRLYHSSAILLTDGRILVGGSNPHRYYNFTGVEYPTDLSLEAYSPPYLSAENEPIRPTILSTRNILTYRQYFTVSFSVSENLSEGELSVSIVAPSFATHSFGMNQRMVVLKKNGVSRLTGNTYELGVVAPSMAEIAPPGYYLLFVVHAGIPSSGMWVRIQ